MKNIAEETVGIWKWKHLLFLLKEKSWEAVRTFLIILKEKGFKDIEVVTVVVSRLKKSDYTMMFGKNTICIVDLLDSLSFLFSQGI